MTYSLMNESRTQIMPHIYSTETIGVKMNEKKKMNAVTFGIEEKRYSYWLRTLPIQ